jgi:hypothetical protein
MIILHAKLIYDPVLCIHIPRTMLCVYNDITFTIYRSYQGYRMGEIHISLFILTGNLILLIAILSKV